MARKRKQDENLIPGAHRLTREEQSMGGKASGESRRKSKTYKEIARAINAAPVNLNIPGLRERLELVGLNPEKSQNISLVPATIFTGLLERDMKAVEMWRQLTEDEKIDEDTVYELPARVIGSAFADINRQIKPNIRYVFKGGRGGLKSSFISLKIVELLKNNPDFHACITRKIGATLKDSVFAQMQWAIRELGLEDQFKSGRNPLEITLKKTGQKIYFRGIDDPMKLKGIKVPFGYIAVLWKEELDQLSGPDEERMVNQSVLRGGEIFYDFCSYNPPRTRQAWVNRDEISPEVAETVFHTSCYLDAPQEWLGPRFIDDAEFLKKTNPAAYENEYLGIANGDGGSVFENLEIREITDEEIIGFDRIYMGVDWGWFPDPYQWVKMHYDAAHLTLYIFDEYRAKKQTNAETFDVLVNEKGVTDSDSLICDNSENKSIGDYKSWGLTNARSAIKGPESVKYGIKWLQSLVKIVIDNVRCPYAAKEFSEYEYLRDKEGHVISGYPDANNHAIDATRYAMEPVWKRRGQ